MNKPLLSTLFLAGAFVALGFACGPEPGPGESNCGDTLCAAGQHCADPNAGFCENGCLTDANCPVGTQCTGIADSADRTGFCGSGEPGRGDPGGGDPGGGDPGGGDPGGGDPGGGDPGGGDPGGGDPGGGDPGGGDPGGGGPTDCQDFTLSAFSCGAADPCGWQNDGFCDAACDAFSPTPFDDSADCAGGGDPGGGDPGGGGPEHGSLCANNDHCNFPSSGLLCTFEGSGQSQGVCRRVCSGFSDCGGLGFDNDCCDVAGGTRICASSFDYPDATCD